MISIQGISCSAGIMPMLACLPIILLTEMKSLSGSLSMVIGEGKEEGESGGEGEGVIGREGEGVIGGEGEGERGEWRRGRGGDWERG